MDIRISCSTVSLGLQQLTSMLAQILPPGGTNINVNVIGSDSDQACPDVLTAKMLEPYIRAGLVTADLKPATHLSAGAVSLLAHDIAMRYNMRKFWPYFKQIWGSSCNSSYHSKYVNTPNGVKLMRQLKDM